MDREKDREVKWLPVAKAVAVIVLICLYSYGTVSRNALWQSTISLWTDAVRKSPNSARAHLCYGFALFHLERIAEARQEIALAAKLNPALVEEYTGKAIVLSDSGSMDQALFKFNVAVQLAPDNAESRYNLGSAYDAKGWLDLAIEQYQIAIRLRPDYADARNNLGVAYGKKGLLDNAVEQFQAALRLNSGDPSYHRNIAKAYEMKGRRDKAEEHRRTARSLDN